MKKSKFPYDKAINIGVDLKTLYIPALATIIAFVWGANFIVINELLEYVGPLTILTIQFIACLPFAFFVKRPKGYGYVVLWGLTAGIGQYGLQIKGLSLGVSPGIASVLLQLQAFFTPVLLSIFLKQKFDFMLVPILCLGFIGVYLLATVESKENPTYLLAIILLILASFSWALGNITIAKMDLNVSSLPMFAIVIHAGAVVSLPMLIWSSLDEGLITQQINAYSFMEQIYVFILFLWVLFAYLAGYYLWNTLIQKHGGNKVAKYSLLVPVFGLLLSNLFYATFITNTQIAGILIVGIALIISNYLDQTEEQNRW